MLEVKIRFLGPVRKEGADFLEGMWFFGYITVMQSKLEPLKLWAWMEFYEPIKPETWGSASDCLMCFRHSRLIILEEHQHFCSLPIKMPQNFEQIIPLCIEDLPILLFLSCRKYILEDKYDIVMNRLEANLLSLYNLFSVCRITGMFVGRQCTGICFEPFITVRIEPLCLPPTKALW